MNFYFPIFFIFVIFLAWFAYERGKATRLDKARKDEFWQRETDANFVRRKSLDDLPYITIPDNLLLPNLSSQLPADDPELIRCSDILSSLMDKRILNLTGKTTTDIKFMYGPANLTQLDEYDMNFTLFAQTIYAYGDQLHKLGFDLEAIKVLRFGIDSLSDISGNYKLLATLYAKYNQKDKLAELRAIAEKLDSLMKNSILRTLDEIAAATPETTQTDV